MEKNSSLTFDAEAITDIAAGLGAGLFLLDKDFRIIWHNRVLRDWFEPVNLRNHPTCYQMFFRQGNACEHCPAQIAFKRRRPSFAEKTLKIKSRGRRHFFIDATPIKNERSEVIRTLVLMQDITRIKKLQEQIIRERDFSHKVIDNAKVIIVTLDRQGKIVSFNKTSEELTGYRKDEVVKKNWLDLFIHPRARKDIEPLFEQLQKGERRYQIFEHPVVTKKGEILIISWRNTVISDERGNVSLILLIGEDITETKRMEEQLLQSQKLAAVGQIAAAVAHEVNNPTLVISGRAELIEMKHQHNQEVLEAVRVIKEQCGRITEVTKRLLNFSRVSEPALEPSDINKLLDNTLPLLKYQVKTGNIQISKSYHSSLPQIRINAKQIQEVFLNALRNAVEAMPGGGELVISTTVSENNVVVKISDTGPGIARDDLDKIFNPFYTTKPGGTGLGLFISHQIVRSHSGAIEAQSETEKGTVLSIRLPIFAKNEEDYEKNLNSR